MDAKEKALGCYKEFSFYYDFFHRLAPCHGYCGEALNLKTIQKRNSTLEAAFPEGIHNMNWHDATDVKYFCLKKNELTFYVALVISRPAVLKPGLVLSITGEQARESNLNTSEVRIIVTSTADGCSQFGL